jgi:hypothetical protein
MVINVVRITDNMSIVPGGRTATDLATDTAVKIGGLGGTAADLAATDGTSMDMVSVDGNADREHEISRSGYCTSTLSEQEQ